MTTTTHQPDNPFKLCHSYVPSDPQAISIHRCRFLSEIEAFSDFGSSTLIEKVDGIEYFVNEFWTSRQRQANRLHEISYRACFKPQLPAFFISRLTKPGDVVYDPFMGRGTTPLEAALAGRIPYGNDINPLSKALLEPRLITPTLSEVHDRLQEIPWGTFNSFKNAELLAFYHEDTLAQLEGLRNLLLARSQQGELDIIDKWIRMVALNRLTGHSSGFFSVYSLPPNQAVSVKRQLAINLKRNQTPPLRDVPSLIYKKSKTLLSQTVPPVGEHLLLTSSSCETAAIGTSSVTLTVTSPPFLDIVQYASDNWLRCWFLGLDSRSMEISVFKDVNSWRQFVVNTLSELARITKPHGYIAFEVGEVRKGSVKLELEVIKAAKGLPLSTLGVMINQQDFTKTSNCWGISNNSSGTNSNRIVVFQKNGK